MNLLEKFLGEELKLNLGQRQDCIARGQQEQESSKQGVVARGHLVKGKKGRSCLYLETRKPKVRSGKLSVAKAWDSGPVT